MTDAAAAAPVGAAPAATPAGQNAKSSVAGKNQNPPAGAKPAGAAASARPAASPPADKIRGPGGEEIPDDIEELKRGYGHMKAANERMRLAAEKEKAAEERVRAAEGRAGELEAAFKAAETGDYTQLVRKVGYEKAKEFAEMLLLSEIEWNEMTPEQQRAARLEKENERYRKRDAEAKAADEAKKKAAEEQRAFKDIDDEVSAALKELGKTPTPRVVMRVVEHLLADIESDETKARPVSAKDAYKRVVTDIHADIGEYLSGLSAAELRQVLPKAVQDTMRNADVEDVLAQDPLRSGRRPAPTNQHRDNEQRRKKVSSDDFWAKKEKKFGGRR